MRPVPDVPVRDVPVWDVPVWDLPVRVFHWGTAALIPVLWASERWNWLGVHVWAGIALLALVLFRLMWGVVGSDTARFARFLRGPRPALAHLRGMFRHEPDHAIGHNPAGGWMVALLLLLVTAECLIGVFVNNDVADAGPLTELAPTWLLNLATDLHWWLFQVLLGAIALHLAAVLAYRVAKGQNLVGPMVTGRKPLPADIAAPRMVGLGWAAALAVVAGGMALGVFWFG